MKSIFTIAFQILLLLPFVGHSKTIVTKNHADSAYIDTIIPKKVLIVPFFKKMYMSDINRELVQNDKSEIWTIVSKFSRNMAGTLKQQLAPRLYTPEVLEVKNPDPKQDDDLKLVERSISYKYDPVPVIIPVDKKKKKKDKKVGDEQPPEDTEKYMRTVITSPTLLTYLHEKYGADYIIFLNQFDIRNDYSNPTATISGPAQRIIKLHYTVFNPKGESVCSNRSTTTLPSDVNKADEIIKKYFAPLAAQVAACLPEGAYMRQKIKK